MSAPRLQHPRHGALLFALALGVLAYVTSHSFHWPVLTYLPVRGEWSWHPVPGALEMHYFGIVLWGVVGFGVGLAVGHLPALARRWPARALPVVSVAVLLGGLAYYLIRELTEWS
jgi:hypothetical protein